MAELSAAGAAYRLLSIELARAVVAELSASWSTLPDLRDATAFAWAGRAATLVEAAQGQVAAATDAYLALTLGSSPAGIPPGLVATEALRGVTAAELWTRPATTVWSALARGVPFDAASHAGLARATELAETNLQLAHTHTARAVLDRHPRVVGYRRAPRGAGSCRLCLLAATRRYKRADLMPIHAHCHCTVAAHVAGEDPGPVLDPEGLAALKAAEADGAGVATRHHTEVGPVLVDPADNFAGAHRVTDTGRADDQAAAVAAAMS